MIRHKQHTKLPWGSGWQCSQESLTSSWLPWLLVVDTAVFFSRRAASKTNSLHAFRPEDDRSQEGIKSCYNDSQPTAQPVALMSVCLFIIYIYIYIIIYLLLCIHPPQAPGAPQLTLIQIIFWKWYSPSVSIKTGLAHQRINTKRTLS